MTESAIHEELAPRPDGRWVENARTAARSLDRLHPLAQRLRRYDEIPVTETLRRDAARFSLAIAWDRYQMAQFRANREGR